MKKSIENAIYQNMPFPKEVVFDVPFITLTGKNEVYIENYHGIIEYTPEKIRFGSKIGIIKIEGSCLEISTISSENISVKGTIEKIEFL